ncbi:MAG: asparagine synthase (glutamine-hydrolyzing) [Bacteroidales bacterium]
MCGIAGIYSQQEYPASFEIVLKKMLARIHYRGPDECGIITSGKLFMGNVRLNIIDLEGGTQPVCDHTGRYWIVFNGEIFNYLELRSELESAGLVFTTNSDTEVLVQLYSIYGKACLNMLNGQFAFAIWDKKSGEIFLARDRLGIRPLFYIQQQGVFLFASEIKALFQFPGVSRTIDVKSLLQVFTFWAPLTPNTAFENIYELPPGHYLILRDGKATIRRYWELTYTENGSLSVEEAMQKLDELIYDAVRVRLRADVPVGAYLSGGLDSTATTRYIQEIQPHNLQTFSIGFEQAQYDESGFQNEASKYLKTSHKNFVCRDDDITSIFPEIIWHTEVPVIRTAPAPMYFLSKLVRDNNIKVVITGEGADEMFAGYNIFKETIIRQFWSKFPESKYRPLLLKKLYPYIPYIRDASPAMLKMFFGYRLDEVDSPFYSHLIRWNNTSRIKNYLSASFTDGLDVYNPIDDATALLPDKFSSWDPLFKAQWIESKFFMSGYLLSSQGDRIAMANSVEGRYPFLDHRVVEFSASLPANLKLKGLNEKYLLKKLMDGRLPERIVKRPKQAYRAPISHFMNGSKASERLIDMTLGDSNLKEAGVFNPANVARLQQKYSKGYPTSEIDDMALVGVISTQLLYNLFIKNYRESSHAEVSQLNIKKHIRI